VQKYTDIDYDSFPIPDLTVDKHWILLPRAVWLEKRKALDAALAAQRLADYMAARDVPRGTVGGAPSERLDARDLVDFAARWMTDRFRAPRE